MRKMDWIVRWLLIGTLILVSLAFCLWIPGETMAVSSYWAGGPGGEGNWNVASNWMPGGVPVTGGWAFIGDDVTGANGSRTVYDTETSTYASGEPYALAGVDMMARDGNTVELYHSGGTLTLGTHSSLTINGIDGESAVCYLEDAGVLVY